MAYNLGINTYLAKVLYCTVLHIYVDSASHGVRQTEAFSVHLSAGKGKP